MAKWHFWGEKEFSDVYENIYIRGVNEDWLNIIFAITKDISSLKPLKKKLCILDVGCGEGHTAKQILDRIERPYICDLLEPNKSALATAATNLRQENYIGNVYVQSLATFQPKHSYDVIYTIHTNYYWALNEKDYQQQLKKLTALLSEGGKLIILTLPKHSDHYKVMLRETYPAFNYAEYIINFYQKLGFSVSVKKLKMRMYVGDILSTKKSFDLKSFGRFIHNSNAYLTDTECKAFLNKIRKYQKASYLDFADYLLVISNKSN
jgi:trans-aconitate methyltransferase